MRRLRVLLNRHCDSEEIFAVTPVLVYPVSVPLRKAKDRRSAVELFLGSVGAKIGRKPFDVEVVHRQAVQMSAELQRRRAGEGEEKGIKSGKVTE